MKKVDAPRLVQYEESNLPFYNKGCELVDAAHAEKRGVLYIVSNGIVVRNSSTHGCCPGEYLIPALRPKNCTHCKTIDAAIIEVEGWDVL